MANDEQGAFTALRRVSAHHGVALPDVAVALVDVVCPDTDGDYEVDPVAAAEPPRTARATHLRPRHRRHAVIHQHLPATR